MGTGGTSRQVLGCNFGCNLDLSVSERDIMHNRTGGRQPVCTLVGDHKVEETPVPIPNTEVKLNLPMILLSGKVGYRRLLGPTKGNLGRASFVFGLSISRPVDPVV